MMSDPNNPANDPPTEVLLPSVNQPDLTEALEIAAEGQRQFLPRLTVTNPNSDPVAKGLARAGELVVIARGEPKVVATRPDGNPAQVAEWDSKPLRLFVGPWRPHALLLVDKKPKAESFQRGDAAWNEVANHPTAKGQKIEGQAAMTGIDVLFYLPDHEMFAVFFFAKTAKQEAPEFLKYQNKLVAMTAHFIVGSKNKWWGIRCHPVAQEPFAMPEALKSWATKAFDDRVKSESEGEAVSAADSPTGGVPR